MLGWFSIAVLGIACDRTPEIDNIEFIPEVQEQDLKFAHVFRPLEGDWQGTFKIFEYKGIRDADLGVLYNIHFTFPTLLSELDPVDSIWVEQTYESESPFFQRVRIRDHYRDKDGDIHVVTSRGVNKIQNGSMWCVVEQPDEVVVHKGRLEGDAYIWERSVDAAWQKEYFYELVQDSLYTILGWGYYDGSNPSRMPPYFFEGSYHRISDQ